MRGEREEMRWNGMAAAWMVGCLYDDDDGYGMIRRAGRYFCFATVHGSLACLAYLVGRLAGRLTSERILPWVLKWLETEGG